MGTHSWVDCSVLQTRTFNQNLSSTGQIFTYGPQVTGHTLTYLSDVSEGHLRGTFSLWLITLRNCTCIYFCPLRFSNSSVEFFFSDCCWNEKEIQTSRYIFALGKLFITILTLNSKKEIQMHLSHQGPHQKVENFSARRGWKLRANL